MIENKTEKNEDSFRILKEYIENIPAVTLPYEREHYLKSLKEINSQELNKLTLATLKKYEPFSEVIKEVLEHLEFSARCAEDCASQEYGSAAEILMRETKPFLNKYVYKAIMLYKDYSKLLWGVIKAIGFEPKSQEIDEITEDIKRLLSDNVRDCLFKYREFLGASEIVSCLAISKNKSDVKKFNRDSVRKCLFLYNNSYRGSYFVASQFSDVIRKAPKRPLAKMIKFFSLKEVKKFIVLYNEMETWGWEFRFEELMKLDEKLFLNFLKTLCDEAVLNCLKKYKTLYLEDEVFAVFIEVGKTRNLDCILKAADLLSRDSVFEHISLYKDSRAVRKRNDRLFDKFY
ncbi:MAG: hypothetical protein L6420_10930 [Elusimicrobia bacterium]|nr:hypothetical protein [Elusimicrobiota bacterium]